MVGGGAAVVGCVERGDRWGGAEGRGGARDGDGLGVGVGPGGDGTAGAGAGRDWVDGVGGGA